MSFVDHDTAETIQYLVKELEGRGTIILGLVIPDPTPSFPDSTFLESLVNRNPPKQVVFEGEGDGLMMT